MTWNWQKKNWPKFTFSSKKLEKLEQSYSQKMGEVVGALKHVSKKDVDTVVVNILATEGVKTAEIEGEILRRDSVQSSLRKKLGFAGSAKSASAAESGMAEVLTSVYTLYDKKLTHDELHRWNNDMLQGRTDVDVIGAYRTHEDPMYVLSGHMGKEKIHFEAVASLKVQEEMNKFIHWFNESETTMLPLARAGIAHLYSVSIHPYEDGNGRMARLLTEKALSQSLGSPALSGLSRQILTKKSAYYDALERNNKELDITDWLLYFAHTTIDANVYTLQSVERILQKSAVYKKFQNSLNDRQKKVIDKIYAAEPEGFAGGLSAENYIAIAKTSRATATRDLQQLVNMKIFQKTGALRYTRYSLTDL